MRLLIVGGSSVLGRNLIEELVEGSYPLRGVAATFWRDDSFPDFARQRGIEAVRYDALADDLAAAEYDACIYLAGNSDHALAIRDATTDLRLSTLGLLRFLPHYSGHLVYMSSGAVYHGLRGFVSSEVSVAPTFAYGISKLACEHYVKAFCTGRGSRASYVILRLFYAYGRYDKPRRLIPQVVKAVLFDGKQEFCVRGTGSSLLDPVDGRYVARALSQAALCRGLNATLDLCAGEPRTVVQVVDAVARSLGGQLRVTVEGTSEAYPVEFHASPERARAALGLEPPVSLESGVKAYADWLRSSGGRSHNAR